MTEIVLVASYMKSGNTWMRAMIQALVRPAVRGVDINALDVVARWSSDRNLFEQVHGVDPDMLSDAELLSLRPAVFRRIAAASTPPRIYMKAHDANLRVGDGRLFPDDLPILTLHLVRHPYDVAVSLSHHGQIDLDAAIAFMADDEAREGGHQPAHVRRGFRNHSQLPQHVGSWSGHTLSFLDRPAGRSLLVRYEDLLTDPVSELARVTRFLGLASSPSDIGRAIETTRFDRLAGQEEKAGFVERPVGMTRFFRAGRSGSGAALSDRQKAAIDQRHQAAMQRLGYANHDNQGQTDR
jgi:hypothetical protein